MINALVRTAALLGEEKVEHLRHCRVAVFGIGGVGSACAEALARAGIGHLDLFDPDVVSESNLNRQLIALHSTIGQNKAQVMADRIHDILPETAVRVHAAFYSAENAADYPFDGYDYIADCIDTVSSKILILRTAKAANVPVISALGTGNKLHPEMLELADIKKTEVCPLARVMRRLCRENGIDHLDVVYSKEPPARVCVGEENGRHPPASISFVPPAAGMLMAGHIVRALCDKVCEQNDTPTAVLP